MNDNFSLPQAEALRKYQKDAERAQASQHAEKRLDARQSLERAHLALEPRQRAVVDLVMSRGRSLKELAQLSGQSEDALTDLLRSATNKLADHYQSGEAA